jgi:ABC-type bacteriocin/lantibiotic exporter with double-glycine peptidase domain
MFNDLETEAFVKGITAFIVLAIVFLFWYSIALDALLLLPFATFTIVVALFSLFYYRNTPARAERNAERMKLLKKLRKKEEKQKEKGLKQQEKERKRAFLRAPLKEFYK